MNLKLLFSITKFNEKSTINLKWLLFHVKQNVFFDLEWSLYQLRSRCDRNEKIRAAKNLFKSYNILLTLMKYGIDLNGKNWCVSRRNIITLWTTIGLECMAAISQYRTSNLLRTQSCTDLVIFNYALLYRISVYTTKAPFLQDSIYPWNEVNYRHKNCCRFSLFTRCWWIQKWFGC